MVASDIKYVVQLKTKETKDGKFRPSVSVIRQDGRNFNTMTIDLDNGALFVAESAAIKYAKDRITEMLTKHHTQAEILFSARRKVALNSTVFK